MMSESKLYGLRELGTDRIQKADARDAPNLNFMRHSRLPDGEPNPDSTSQNPLGTEKIVKKLKKGPAADDCDSDLNERSVEASIVIKPTLKTQPKHMNNVNAGSTEHMHSSRILGARGGGQGTRGDADGYSDASSACNLLDSSRSALSQQASKGGATGGRRQRYQDESPVDAEHQNRQERNLDSIENLNDFIKLDR